MFSTSGKCSTTGSVYILLLFYIFSLKSIEVFKRNFLNNFQLLKNSDYTGSAYHLLTHCLNVFTYL